MRAALIPVKELSQAKMRLAPGLGPAERASLALAMLADVVDACLESGCFEQVCVLSRDPDVRWEARERGASPLAEPATLADDAPLVALNAGLRFAQKYLARRRGVTGLVVLPADIPLARADDLRAVVDALGPDGDACAIVAARDGGTNALAMRPAELVQPAFGPESARAHRAAARDAGARVIDLALERLAFDVDAPADLDALRGLPAGPSTRAWLDAHARTGRAAV
ncbi:MAG TPA: 2-phospho-L-lactate guanylyltransferase [Dehalococcoidia bacterium]|nr:2-phospho-L-lactate guanylyltransferase [Dehalococcoidia bacterium]